MWTFRWRPLQADRTRPRTPMGVAEQLPGLLRRLGRCSAAGCTGSSASRWLLGASTPGSPPCHRRYAYRVSDAPGGVDPLRRREVVWHTRPLDVDALNAAAARLLGEHDFAAFCKKREGATTIRELQRLDWAREDDGILVATVVADAFCHSMVRALVGSLLSVGDGPPGGGVARRGAGQCRTGCRRERRTRARAVPRRGPLPAAWRTRRPRRRHPPGTHPRLVTCSSRLVTLGSRAVRAFMSASGFA